MKNTRVALFLSLPLPFFFFAVQELAIAAAITFTNNCSYTVWPGIFTDNEKTQLSTTGFELATGTSESVTTPSTWWGRIWARTGCSNDSGIFLCVTGDCGSGQAECNSTSASPPATFAELTIASSGGQDSYNVSIVNGFNLPMSIAPSGGNGSCKSSSCPANINADCPEELQVRWWDGSVIGCKSACLAFNQSQYCCTGDFSSRDKCWPTSYSQFFREHCPDAYSYVYDDTRLSSNFTCSGRPDYIITFCPDKPKQATIMFTNECPYTVWPATLTGNKGPQLSKTGFELPTGAASDSVYVLSPWAGRFWACTGCSSNSGNFACATGDCASGQVECNGAGGIPPATLVELFVTPNGQDFYDISYVDGFNVGTEKSHGLAEEERRIPHSIKFKFSLKLL